MFSFHPMVLYLHLHQKTALLDCGTLQRKNVLYISNFFYLEILLF
jgi:hypothetical protein